MKSHSYDFAGKDLALMLAAPLLPLMLFALAMHVGAATGILPHPQPALDTDRTILTHQADATRRKHDADLLLIGDSSCLMDVSAEKLGSATVFRALNVGTLSYLDLSNFAELLRHYAEANPNRLRAVVLLMHPEALRQPAGTEYYAEALAKFYIGKDYCTPMFSPSVCALGVEIFRGRILGRLIPLPLAGVYGRSYGFTHDLWEYLSNHRGSALDPGEFHPGTVAGNAEYRLAVALERNSRNFRAAVPDGARLIVGITPIPESFADTNYRQRYRDMLNTWSEWLKADAVLTEMPGTLADDLFASTTHLNSRGVEFYTAELARALSRHVPPR